MDLSSLKLGILGFGNMASSICDGLLLRNVIDPNHIIAYSRNRDRLLSRTESRNIRAAESAEKLAKECDVLLVGVLPHQVETALTPLIPFLEGKSIICIAAGLDCKTLSAYLPETIGHINVIPNTPVKVAEGIFVCESTHTLNKEQTAVFEDLFGKIAIIEYVPSHLLSLGGTLSGCTPAFAAIIIEALGDAGVKYGMDRSTAYRLAAQVLIGTGHILLETGQHPGIIKDTVCSPGGTTIRGVSSLEKNSFRSALIESIDAIME